MGKPKLERGFYWRKGVIWYRTDPVTGRPKSTKCHDQQAAKLWRAERERLAGDPLYAAATQATVGDWVKRTMANKTAHKRAGTVHMYKVKLGHVVRIFGADAPLATITADAVDNYIITRRAEGVVNHTIVRELNCLRQMLKLAKRAKQFRPDLAEVMPIAFSSDYVPRKRTLAPADFPLLWEALPHDEARAWVALALATAADKGDVERALSEDYDQARNVFRVRGTKNAVRDAEVPILPHVADLFAFALARLPVSWPSASKALGEACRRAGIQHLSPKDLRRTAATWLVAGGADISNVSRFLRHKSDAMVRQVYGQVRPEELGGLLERQARTPALHLPPSVAKSGRNPAAEMAGGRAQKADPGDADAGQDREFSGVSGELNPTGVARNRAVPRTRALHRPSVWALVFAAEAAGLRSAPAVTAPAAPKVYMVTVVSRRGAKRHAG